MPAEETAARLALRELVLRYAQLADDRDFARIPEVFTEDAELRGPGYALCGHAQLRAGLSQLAQYRATLHAVHNQLVTLDGERATGETYCVAHHLYERAGVARKLEMGIRYQDAYQNEAGRWRIATRVLRVVWEQDQALAPPARRGVRWWQTARARFRRAFARAQRSVALSQTARARFRRAFAWARRSAALSQTTRARLRRAFARAQRSVALSQTARARLRRAFARARRGVKLSQTAGARLRRSLTRVRDEAPRCGKPQGRASVAPSRAR